MTKYDDLQQEYQKKLEQLQESCPHQHLSPWMTVMEGAGRFCEYDTQICTECNKQIHCKWWCNICGKELIDDMKLEGNGIDHPFGLVICEDCQKIPYTGQKAKRQTMNAWENFEKTLDSLRKKNIIPK